MYADLLKEKTEGFLFLKMDVFFMYRLCFLTTQADQSGSWLAVIFKKKCEGNTGTIT